MSKIAIYNDALADLKAQEFDGSALLTVSGYLIKLIAAWPVVTTWIETKETREGLHPAWGMTRFDVKEWARLAQVDEAAVWKSWQGLAKMNLIYPDNTFPDKVAKFLLLRSDDLLSLS